MLVQRNFGVLSATLLSAIVVSACGGKTVAPAPLPPPAPTTSATTKPVAKKPHQVDLRRFLGPRANLMGVLRPNKLHKTKLTPFVQRALQWLQLEAVPGACKIDPLKDVDLIMFAMEATTSNTRVFIRGNLDMARWRACFAALAARSRQFVWAQEGALIKFKFDNNVVYARWLNGGLLISPVKKNLNLLRDGGPSTEMRRQIDLFDPTATLSFAATSTALVEDVDENIFMKFPVPVRPTRLVVNVFYAGDLRALVTAAMPAELGAMMIKQKLDTTFASWKTGPMRPLFANVKADVTTSGSSTTLNVQVPESTLDAFLTLATSKH